MIIYPENCPCEGHHLTESNEDGLVYLACRADNEARDKKAAAYDYEKNCEAKLQPCFTS